MGLRLPVGVGWVALRGDNELQDVRPQGRLIPRDRVCLSNLRVGAAREGPGVRHQILIRFVLPIYPNAPDPPDAVRSRGAPLPASRRPPRAMAATPANILTAWVPPSPSSPGTRCAASADRGSPRR